MKTNPWQFSSSMRCIRIGFILLLFAFFLPDLACADDLYPPSFLSAISDQDGEVPLFWFSPHPDTFEIAYHGEDISGGMHVVLPWRENCAAVRMRSPSVPFHLLKSRFYLVDQETESDSGSFFVTVNEDSAGIPKNAFVDSVSASASGEDSLSEGGWVDIQHDLLMQDSVFWVVFHWEEGSPASPLVGRDALPNCGSSFWGKRTFYHFEWHHCAYNLMMEAEIAANGESSSSADSFKVFRSIHPESLIYQHNVIAALPGLQFQHADSEVVCEQTFFYRVTALNSQGQTKASNLAQATPKRGAALEADRGEFSVYTDGSQQLLDNLTLTNSGGLPLSFRIGISMQGTDWMGGSDSFGYNWTSSALDAECEFAWVDIQDRGIPLGNDGDDNADYGFFHLGFSFPFYSSLFDSLRIASDGWLSFSHLLPCYTDTFKCYINKGLPWLRGPYYLVAPFWDDLILVDSSAIYFYSKGDSAVISFINLHHYGAAVAGPYTFQAILTSSGEITFQYLHIYDSAYSATVGIQNMDGTVGLQVLHNESNLLDSLAIEIRPSWVRLDSMKGCIQPGEDKTLSLTFDPLLYPQGIYHADLLIDSWDKNHQLEDAIVPLVFCVDTTTSVGWTDAAAPDEITLLRNYPNPFNPSTSIEFMISKSGQVKVEIVNILGQRVRALVDEYLEAGYHLARWDGTDDSGQEVSSGIYLYHISTSELSQTRKMLLLK